MVSGDRVRVRVSFVFLRMNGNCNELKEICMAIDSSLNLKD